MPAFFQDEKHLTASQYCYGYKHQYPGQIVIDSFILKYVILTYFYWHNY